MIPAVALASETLKTSTEPRVPNGQDSNSPRASAAVPAAASHQEPASDHQQREQEGEVPGAVAADPVQEPEHDHEPYNGRLRPLLSVTVG
jgi:hypothetical protein